MATDTQPTITSTQARFAVARMYGVGAHELIGTGVRAPTSVKTARIVVTGFLFIGCGMSSRATAKALGTCKGVISNRASRFRQMRSQDEIDALFQEVRDVADAMAAGVERPKIGEGGTTYWRSGDGETFAEACKRNNVVGLPDITQIRSWK